MEKNFSQQIFNENKNFKKNGKIKWSVAQLFLIPWAIGFTVFRIYPFFDAFYLSFTRSRIGQEPQFVGLDNFYELFFGRTQAGIDFRSSLGVTFRYVFLTVPLVLVIALFVAFILNFKIKGIAFFRTAFYIPSILGGSVSVAILWQFVFGNNGLINSILEVFGLRPVGWLVNPGTAIVVLALLRAWQFGSAMLIFLSALQGIPRSLYEAASIDGAKLHQQFLRITLPMITPVVLFNLVNLLIGAFQEFNAAFLITEGGPMGATYLVNLFIYDRAFVNMQFGMSAAASWILFIIIMLFTIIVFKSSNRWVYYEE